jgi:hypothetical protein
MNMERWMQMESMVKVKLSFIYTDTGRLPEAAALLQAVCDYRTK